MRALLVMYIMSLPGMEISDALEIYGWFTIGVYVTQGLGGVVGDLGLGNKMSMLIGAGVQGLGVFSLMSGNAAFLNVSLALIAIGSGLYTPNAVGRLAQQYLQKDKRKLMDAGFALFYSGINLGAFLGIMYITRYEDDYSTGFMMAGVLAFIAIVPLLFTKNDKEVIEQLPPPKYHDSTVRTLVISTAAFVIAFWGMYEFTGSFMYEIESSIEMSLFFEGDENATVPWWLDSTKINSYVVVGLTVIGFFWWSTQKISQYKKLMIGFGIAALAYLLYQSIPDSPTMSHAGQFAGAAVLLAVAEVFIQVAALGVYALTSNPRRIATVYGLVAIGMMLGNKFFQQAFDFSPYDNPLPMIFLIAAAVMIGVLGIVYNMQRNYRPLILKSFKKNEEDEEISWENESDELDQLS